MEKWQDVDKYNPKDKCSICYEEYGTTQAIYKTPCNHMFHNNCLNEYCEHHEGEIVCPLCRADIEYTCMDVWAFKNKSLGSQKGIIFDNEHVDKIYNSQTMQGGRRKRRKLTKRRKRTKRTKRTKGRKGSKKHRTQNTKLRRKRKLLHF